mgnify:CR=1 FL=1
MTDKTLKPLTSPARREFLLDAGKTACGLSLAGLCLGLYSHQTQALPPGAIRPPGALPEADFLGACIRCGLCVRDCPYQILKLATPGEHVATGTPYFVARNLPCEMCEDIPCVKACPSGALDHSLTDINKAQMGLAVLIDHETCLNFLGLRCDVCYRVCPLIDTAITLEQQHNTRTDKHAVFIPTGRSDAGSGCGKGEKGCVRETPAIKVLPRPLAKAEAGKHYRLGWEEKKKAGQSLIEEQGIVDLPDRMPDATPDAAPGGLPPAKQGNQL